MKFGRPLLYLCFSLVSIRFLFFEPIHAEFLKFQSYKVQKNDTIYGISKKYKIALHDFYRWNPAKRNSPQLVVGEILKIPIFGSGAGSNPRFSGDSNQIAYDLDWKKFSSPLRQQTKIQRAFSSYTVEPHKGVLVKAGSGPQTVYSSRGGRIVAIDYMEGYGNYIIIQHPEGFYTVYARLEKIWVLEGQTIPQGEKLGNLSPNSGLYFQLNYREKPIDPQPLFTQG
jgi:murein DD-endopeptidase MepM/ murein hydrolase activator NlpD